MPAKLPRQATSVQLKATLDEHVAECRACRWALRRFLKASADQLGEEIGFCGFGLPVVVQLGRALGREQANA